MGKFLPVKYSPTTPPIEFKDWHRWIDDELRRIENAIRSQNTLFAVEGDSIIDIAPIINTVVMGIGDAPSVDFPGGNWNSATGEWTCPETAIYNINASAVIEPFGTGNKTYFARIDLLVNDINEGSVTDGGLDDIELGVAATKPLAMSKGDVLKLTLSVLHEQFTGTSIYSYSYSVIKVADV